MKLSSLLLNNAGKQLKVQLIIALTNKWLQRVRKKLTISIATM